ncbi:MAG: cation diffusion facilitator family transporter [Dehalococcoidia bacterium]
MHQNRTHSPQVDPAIVKTQRGIWAIKVSFLGLMATALLQAVVVGLSGSAALLADTVHNLADATTAIPLWIGFSLSRRRESRRFPYGYHRAEDLAGIAILLAIAGSAAFAGYESVRKLVDDEVPRYLPLAIAAGGVGFLGNELVAQFRIRIGKRIGSASLVADGHHARADGLTSLAVMAGLTGVALGFPAADPIVGLVITAVIAFILFRDAGPLVLSRIMDRVDAGTVGEIEQIAKGIEGVRHVRNVRARWTGHFLLAELSVAVDSQLTVAQGHQIAEEVQHQLLHEIPMLYRCMVHVDPVEIVEAGHEITDHHFPGQRGENQNEED